jgi:hypothetical protein
MRLRRLPFGAVRPRGWVAAQMRRDLEEGFAGCLDRLSPHVANDLFANRLDGPGSPAGWWDAESRGNWLWGYLLLASLTDSADHRRRAEALVRGLRNTQDEDGYLGIYRPDGRFAGGGTENGELWAQSRALLVLLSHHELTGDTGSLLAARRTVDRTLRPDASPPSWFGRHPTTDDRTGVTHGLCFVDALQMLEECTGEPGYREAARTVLGDFDAWPAPFPNDDLARPCLADADRALRGHAVHTAEHLRALVFDATDPGARIRAALRKVASSTTPSGALIGDESLHGLPHPQAAYEYCTLTELAFSLVRLGEFTADPALGDWLERLVFNAAQGARTPDGRALAYLSMDTRHEASAALPDSYSLLSGRHGRFKLSPTHDDVACCCNPNATRLLPHYLAGSWLARSGAEGFVALAHGPSQLHARVEGAAVVIMADTAYPFEDEIRYEVRVQAPRRFGLWLRRPGWVRAAAVEGVESVASDGWLQIVRDWEGHTRFVLRFDAVPRAERYPQGTLAVMRGPLQFVLPLRHRVRHTPVAGRDAWPDAELFADADDAARATPVVDESLPGLGFEIRRPRAPDVDDPWHASPLVLSSAATRLEPMGCALLRRADFVAVSR